MADTSYATKYRPNSLSDYIGDETVSTIKNIMSGDPSTWPHVWLFYGERGTGKTTMARLLSKWYECLEPTKDGPCNHCEMCQDLDENLIYSESGADAYYVSEIDIATDSGKAKIMQVLEEACIPPQAPIKFKVLILDECHRASEGAQNSLLKICEEPPSHLVIMFCTTNPEEMLSTLYDRCTFKIRAHKANPDDLLERLKMCCEKEQISYSVPALKTLIKKCKRNPRQSFNKLEEIAKSNQFKCDMDAVQRFTEENVTQQYLDYFDASQAGLGDLMRYVKSLQEKDVDLKRFLRGLSGFVLDCIKVRYGLCMDEFTTDFVRAAGKMFKDYTSSQLDTLMQVVEYANAQIGNNRSSDEFVELIVTTTGMRISKLNLLAQGLQNEASQAVLETKQGSQEAISIMEQEYEASKPKVVPESLTGSLLMATYGKQVAEVSAGNKNVIGPGGLIDDSDEEDDFDDEDSKEFANSEEFQEELRKLGLMK